MIAEQYAPREVPIKAATPASPLRLHDAGHILVATALFKLCRQEQLTSIRPLL